MELVVLFGILPFLVLKEGFPMEVLVVVAVVAVALEALRRYTVNREPVRVPVRIQRSRRR